MVQVVVTVAAASRWTKALMQPVKNLLLQSSDILKKG